MTDYKVSILMNDTQDIKIIDKSNNKFYKLKEKIPLLCFIDGKMTVGTNC